MASRHLAACLVVTACALVSMPAAQAAPVPGAPTQRVTAVGHTSVTVSASAAHATSYRLFVSTTRGDLLTANIAGARRTPATRSRSLRMTGLPYTTRKYYFRVAAIRGAQRHFAATIGSVSLAPTAPTALTLTNTGTVYSLSWTGAGATGYQVEQSTGAAMTTNRIYTLRTATPQLTPYGLAANRTYFFRVRALNDAATSPWTDVVSSTVTTSEQSFTVMSYNILEAKFGGTEESGNTVAPWSSRRAGVASLIEQAHPDILTIQEGSTFVGPAKNTRQVDDLDDLLPDYKLARTEDAPNEQPVYYRHGVYVLYRTDAFAPVYAAGIISTGHGYAAEVGLRSLTTGAELIAVSPHLPKGAGRASDEMRQGDTETMVQRATFASDGIPVVYAGDYNSNDSSTHVFDGSGRAMQAVGHADAITAAQTSHNARYNSANQYRRTPPARGDSIDHIYASPGMAVQSYAVVLDLVDGRFVGPIPSDHNPIIARVSIRY